MEKLKAITRTKEIGSNKSLLNKGLVPGIIYGKGTEPTKIAFENQLLKRLMQSKGFYTKIYHNPNFMKSQILNWSNFFYNSHQNFLLGINLH